MAARVAIAMAVYNDARYLVLALEALRAQTFRDFHLTILDDESSDESAAVAEAYVGRLPMTVIRAAHRGRHHAKRAVADAISDESPFLLVLDSDVALPPDALARMVRALDADPRVAVVCAHARALESRPLGQAQAFLDDLRLHAVTDEAGHTSAIVGGCAMFRRAALDGVEIRSDIGEDNDLSEKLAATWSLLSPRDLVATHYGVPTTMGGVLRRFEREGVRVRAFLRVYPRANRLHTLSRLIPLPLSVAAVAGVVTAQPWVTGGAAARGLAYVGAFLVASRRVPAPLAVRGRAALLFAAGNLGFGVGYLREALRGRSEDMREPRRSF
jgi:glycosyltransferase involved in cell wall biosynthesis